MLVVAGMTTSQHGRRQFLAGSSGVASVLALSACSSAGEATGPPSNAPPAGRKLIALAEIPVGEARSVSLGERELIVARPDGDSAVAFSAVCTHQGCTVAPAENKLRCPCHGSTYRTLTGEVISGPAPKPLREVAVRVVDGTVVTAEGD